MGSKHGKYVYVEVAEGLYAKIRVFKKRDPKSEDAYLFTGVFVKKPPRRARILSRTDIPEKILSVIESSVAAPGPGG